MTDDISKVVPPVHAVTFVPSFSEAARRLGMAQAQGNRRAIAHWRGIVDAHETAAKAALRLESATTPAEVDVPTIDRDEAFQRDYIPLGRSGWEIQTKGKGSTYRLCEPEGHRLAIPNEPSLHETLTRMARDVHADYATLARQLAEAKAENERLSGLNSQLVKKSNTQVVELARVEERLEQAESQLAEATRRLGEVEGLLRECQRRLGAEESLRHMTYREWSELDDRIDAALTKEPTK